MKGMSLAHQSVDLLEEFLFETSSAVEDERFAFIYRHARNIWDLAQDALLLLDDSRTSSLPILMRTMLESLFKLVAAVKLEGFAIEKLISEADCDVVKMRKWLKIMDDKTNPIMLDGIEMAQSLSKRLRRDYGVTSKKKWNVFETAEAAGMGDQYKIDYYMFSQHIHASIKGIIAQEHYCGVCMLIPELVFVASAAVGHAVRLLPTQNPKRYLALAADQLDAASQLLGQRNHGNLGES